MFRVCRTCILSCLCLCVTARPDAARWRNQATSCASMNDSAETTNTSPHLSLQDSCTCLSRSKEQAISSTNPHNQLMIDKVLKCPVTHPTYYRAQASLLPLLVLRRMGHNLSASGCSLTERPLFLRPPDFFPCPPPPWLRLLKRFAG